MDTSEQKDHQSSFESLIIHKHRKDIYQIDNKLIYIYAKEMPITQNLVTIKDIYEFEVS